MTKTISHDTPLAEITLRKYERPTGLSNRDLVRKFCLSTGLLQPGDSRDVIVDILHVLLRARKDKQLLSTEEIQEQVITLRKEESIAVNGTATSNIRRQLRRLRELFLAEKVRNAYRINEHANISQIFEEEIKQYLLNSVLSRVKEYVDKIDAVF